MHEHETLPLAQKGGYLSSWRSPGVRLMHTIRDAAQHKAAGTA